MNHCLNTHTKKYYYCAFIIPAIPNAIYDLNNHMGAGTIHNKLQGTVYDLDFDEDLKCGDNMENLKSMRERRRSIDYRHQSDASYRSRDASESPKFTTTAANSQKIGKLYFVNTFQSIA